MIEIRLKLLNVLFLIAPKSSKLLNYMWRRERDSGSLLNIKLLSLSQATVAH